MKTARVTKDQGRLFYLKLILMRFCLLFLLNFLLTSEALSQDSTDYHRFASSFDVIYGQKNFQNEVLGNAVNSLDQFSVGQPISSIGIGLTGILVVNRKRRFPTSVHFNHLIPQKIALNDSIAGRVSGFNVGIPLTGWDVFSKKRWIDLILGAGFKTGRIRLFGDSRLEQINAYFAPCITIAPRFNFGKISLQFRAEYELDITRSRWRNVWFSNSPKADLGPMKSTGLSTSVSVGWVF